MNDVAGMGHNISPEDAAFDKLDERQKALIEIGEKWLTERPEITDDKMAGKCHDFITQVNGAIKAVEAARVEHKAPHIAAGKAVDARFIPLKGPLDILKGKLSPRLTAYLNKKERQRQEEERRKAEEAARAAAEAEDARAAAEANNDSIAAAAQAEEAARAAEAANKEAAAIAKSRASVKGDYSSRSASLRTTYSGKIVDQGKVYRRFRDHPKVIAVLQELVNAEIRHNPDLKDGTKTLPGVEVVKETTAV